MKQKFLRIKALLLLFVKNIQQEGLHLTLQKAIQFTRRRLKSRKGRLLPTYEQLLEQREQIDIGVISVVIPLFNTEQMFLEQLVDSLLLQSYRFFELCFADASDDEHSYVGEFIKNQKDARIKYVKIQNDGISANTNAAAALASGEILTFCDHDDILSEDAFYEIITAFNRTGADFVYSDEALFDVDYKLPAAVHYKPGFSLHYLRSCNYICHLTAVRKELFFTLGGLQSEYDGSQDHDFILRVYDSGAAIYHISRVLYYWRVHSGSTSGGTQAKPFVTTAAKKAIASHLERCRVKGDVEEGLYASTYKVNYAIPSGTKVSIVIPTSDHKDDLQRCITSILEKTLYRYFEIILVENNSKNPETFEYYESILKNHDNISIINYEGEFNFSAICNAGAAVAKGQHILLLNNDVEVINGEWISELLGISVQPEVGAVGAKLLYPDDRVQHAGVVTGLGGFAGHSHKYFKDSKSGYMFRLSCINNFSAVTGACLMVKKQLYKDLGGLYTSLAVAYNDVDFCLRLSKSGYYNVYTPYARLYHHESQSRGFDTKGEKRERFEKEQKILYERYGENLKHDPFYNTGLTLDREDFSEGV